MIYDNLRDIIQHTKTFFNAVKIVNENGVTCVQAISEGNTMILHGKMARKMNDINTCIGLSRMSILDGILKFPPFSAKEAKIEFQSEERNGVKMLSELTFESPDGHKASYRFMNPVEAERKIQVPPFTGAKWDIVIPITKKNLMDLVHFSGVLGGSEMKFKIVAKKGKLDFKIGDTGSDRAIIPMASGVNSLVNENSWRLQEVISILRLSETGQCTMSISDAGLLKIEINSGMGLYEYYLVSVN